MARAKAGAPVRQPADAPWPRRYVAGWRIGAPGAVVQIAEPYRVPAQGVVE